MGALRTVLQSFVNSTEAGVSGLASTFPEGRITIQWIIELPIDKHTKAP